jgi:glyoxylase-like metal-dependent hydrolase (beta-lactamase superfamily II)
MGNTQIIRLNGGTSNIYLLKNGNNLLMIDAGNKDKTKSIIKQLEKLNISIYDIHYILLTHTHFDHCGSLKNLVDITKAKVIACELEKKNLEVGRKEIPLGVYGFSKTISHIGRKIFPGIADYEPVNPDICISGKYDLSYLGFDAYVILTPGHTIGSLSIVVNDESIIVGDTMFNIFKKDVIPPYADDIEKLAESWSKIIALKCSKYYPGHGNIFDNKKTKKSYDLLLKMLHRG